MDKYIKPAITTSSWHTIEGQYQRYVMRTGSTQTVGIDRITFSDDTTATDVDDMAVVKAGRGEVDIDERSFDMAAGDQAIILYFEGSAENLYVRPPEFLRPISGDIPTTYGISGSAGGDTISDLGGNPAGTEGTTGTGTQTTTEF